MKPSLIKLKLREDGLRRTNRRRMAWVSLASMNVFMLLAMFVLNPERIKELSGIIDTFMFCAASVVLSYLGIAAWDDSNLLKHKKKIKPEETEETESEEEAILNPKK